jgi:putative transcriptional regulator
MLTKQHFDDWVLELKRNPAAEARLEQAGLTYEFSPATLVYVRQRTGLSQQRFARLLNVSVKTVQNWEQGRRGPSGPAISLIRIVDREPALALRALRIPVPPRVNRRLVDRARTP